MGLGPPYIGIFPPLNPAVVARRPARPLPFPLEEPTCRLYLEARQGLWSALKGIGIGPGDEILAPAYHHGSEIEAVVRTGAKCRFYDCVATFEPDEEELERLLTPSVRALYVIHSLGFAQDGARWRRWCDERGLLLVEDAAQGWLSSRDGRPVGAGADVTLFCLYKAFGVADGGAVSSRAFAEPAPTEDGLGARGTAGRMADWAAQRSQLAATLFRHRRHPPSQDEDPNVHFALTAVDERATRATRALLSRVVDADAPSRRRAHFARLAERLGDVRSPAFAHMPPESSPLVFPIEVPDKRAVVDRLERDGIVQTRGWTVPHPTLDAARHPGAAALRARLVGLPVHQELRKVDVERIADAVTSAMQQRDPTSVSGAPARRGPGRDR
ncbi:MAG: DegT/DnrJ/EryC1/StrS family aminotransferase [Thermoleophilaceae bacterium]